MDDFIYPSDPSLLERFDYNIEMEVDLPCDIENKCGTIIAWKRKHNGTLIGTENEVPSLDSIIYTADLDGAMMIIQ